ncbi:MAG: hypothetical protein IPH12_22155 [Saprospirales bacterium]|nr:hypothetical protein [Saprospirales bacterium]
MYCKDRAAVRGKYVGNVKINPETDTAFTAILVKPNGGNVQELPLTAIDRVVTRTNKGRTVGFIAGLAVDAIVAVAVMNSFDNLFDLNSDNPGNPNASSCPLIYSHDGTDYRLDAEIFGGAIFRAAERPDWENLDQLRVSEDGLYRLKITNEFDETQQVDFVRLLVIDHPAGVRVYPSFQGEMFTLSDPLSPRKANDFAGQDLRSMLRHNDGDFWLSNPFGRDPGNPAGLRDGIILEFDRSVGTGSAALLLHVQNTLWASGVQKKMLMLPGRELPQWYQTLNESVDAREALIRAMIREGMLRVYIWEDTQWKPAGHIWEVGSMRAKDVVIELDLLNTHSNTLRIKLECPPGMWIVNSVKLDYSYYNYPTILQELLVRKATDQTGRDISLPLLKADDLYYEMPTTRDVAYLEFIAPPVKQGMERSFIVKGGGYYTIHVPTEGEPQTELLQRLLYEPGAFTRFALESLYQETGPVVRHLPQVQ